MCPPRGGLAALGFPLRARGGPIGVPRTRVLGLWRGSLQPPEVRRAPGSLCPVPEFLVNRFSPPGAGALGDPG